MRKRKGYFKRKASRVKSYFSQRRKKNSTAAGEGIMSIALAGAAYGAIRAPVAMAADSILSKLPLPAQVADEVGMGILSYLAYKKGSGFIKKMGKAGLYVESYRVADTFVSPMIAQAVGQVTGGTTNSNSLFVN